MDIYVLDFSTLSEESFRSTLPPPSPPWLNRSNIDCIIIRRQKSQTIVMASCYTIRRSRSGRKLSTIIV